MKKQWFTTIFWDDAAQGQFGLNESDQDKVLELIAQFLNDNHIGPGEFQILPFTEDTELEVGHFPVVYFAEKKIAWAFQDGKPATP